MAADDVTLYLRYSRLKSTAEEYDGMQAILQRWLEIIDKDNTLQYYDNAGDAEQARFDRVVAFRDNDFSTLQSNTKTVFTTLTKAKTKCGALICTCEEFPEILSTGNGGEGQIFYESVNAAPPVDILLFNNQFCNENTYAGTISDETDNVLSNCASQTTSIDDLVAKLSELQIMEPSVDSYLSAVSDCNEKERRVEKLFYHLKLYVMGINSLNSMVVNAFTPLIDEESKEFHLRDNKFPGMETDNDTELNGNNLDELYENLRNSPFCTDEILERYKTAEKIIKMSVPFSPEFIETWLLNEDNRLAYLIVKQAMNPGTDQGVESFLESVNNRNKAIGWLDPKHKMTSTEVKQAREIAEVELDKMKAAGSTLKYQLIYMSRKTTIYDKALRHLSEKEKYEYANYEVYCLLKDKANVAMSFINGVKGHLAPLTWLEEDIIAEFGGTLLEMLGLQTCGDTNQGIEDVDKMYARIMSDKHNASVQHPLVTTTADAVIDTALFMVTGNILESYGLTEGMSATAAFVTNQYAQFVQDATITYMPRYFEYAADGVITENEKQALLREVAVGELANLTLGTFDAIVKMRAASATPAKPVTENTGSGTAEASVNSGVGYKGPEGGSKLKIAEVIPPGSTHPVKVYTDGNAQINTGKIDTYIRGKIELDVKATTTRIDELKDIRKSNPENFTKEMKKELQNCEDMLHNYQRSQEMSKTLNTAGIEDTIENNQMIVENLFDAAKEVTDGNTEIISYIEGANGKVQVISRWKILPDDTRYLATVILKPVK